MSDTTIAALPEVGESPIPRWIGEFAERVQTLELEATNMRLLADELEDEASKLKGAVRAMSK